MAVLLLTSQRKHTKSLIKMAKLKKDGTPKQSGGSRGGGRPIKEGSKIGNVTFRPSQQVAAILARVSQTDDTKTAFIECAILAYDVRLFEKQEIIVL